MFSPTTLSANPGTYGGWIERQPEPTTMILRLLQQGDPAALWEGMPIWAECLNGGQLYKWNSNLQIIYQTNLITFVSLQLPDSSSWSKHRGEDRVPTELRAALSLFGQPAISGRLRDLSSTGAAFTVDSPTSSYQPSNGSVVTLSFSDFSGALCLATILQVRLLDQETVYGLCFNWDFISVRDKIVHYVLERLPIPADSSS